jgi:hypothetical protein
VRQGGRWGSPVLRRDGTWGPWLDGAPGRRRRGSNPTMGGSSFLAAGSVGRRYEVAVPCVGEKGGGEVGVERRRGAAPAMGRARRVWRRRGVAAGSAHPGDGELETTACGSVDASRGCLAPPRARAPGGEDPRGSRLARRRDGGGLGAGVAPCAGGWPVRAMAGAVAVSWRRRACCGTSATEVDGSRGGGR